MFAPLTSRLFKSAVARFANLKYLPSYTVQRHTSHDFVTDQIGNREIVGYGWNGSYCYADRVDYPFPAIRFQEPNADICALREKERADWHKLTMSEKKQLYRYSFCQTFSEFKAPTGDYKLYLGVGIWAVALGIMISFSYYFFLYSEYPITFDEDHRKAQLKRIIALEMNPVTGLASKWDYDNNTWK